jgi:hypothetical protein
MHAEKRVAALVLYLPVLMMLQIQTNGRLQSRTHGRLAAATNARTLLLLCEPEHISQSVKKH